MYNFEKYVYFSVTVCGLRSDEELKGKHRETKEQLKKKVQSQFLRRQAREGNKLFVFWH